MGRRGAAAALLAGALALTACSAGGDEPPASTPTSAVSALPEGVTVQLVQLRSDVASRQVEVEVRNAGDQDLTIGAVAVSDARFAGPAPRVLERDSLVRAGGMVDIRVQLPAMNCDAPHDGEGTVHLELNTGATTRQAEAPIDDPLDFLAPLHERECLAQAVADAASLSLSSFTPSSPGEAADLALEIVPTGNGEVVVGGIQTTNLLTFAAGPGSTDDTFPIEVAVAAGDTEPTQIHLPLVPFRCDPHAVQEDKRGTIFTIEIELEGQPGEIELAADEAMRGQMLTWVSNWCGFGSG